MKTEVRVCFGILVLLVSCTEGPGQDAPPTQVRSVPEPVASSLDESSNKNSERFKNLFSSSPEEPLAKQWSLENSANYLDQASKTWLARWKCAACHTGYLTLLWQDRLFGKHRHLL